MVQLGSERNDRPADVSVPEDQPQVFHPDLVQEIPTFNPDALPRASESPPQSLLVASSSDKDRGIADIGNFLKKSFKETTENGYQKIGHLGKQLLCSTIKGITPFCSALIEWMAACSPDYSQIAVKGSLTTMLLIPIYDTAAIVLVIVVSIIIIIVY